VLPVGLVEEDRGEVVGGGSGREKWRELMGTVSWGVVSREVGGWY
jgi:hypothetical protein